MRQVRPLLKQPLAPKHHVRVAVDIAASTKPLTFVQLDMLAAAKKVLGEACADGTWVRGRIGLREASQRQGTVIIVLKLQKVLFGH